MPVTPLVDVLRRHVITKESNLLKRGVGFYSDILFVMPLLM
jgi:hypothetical protein